MSQAHVLIVDDDLALLQALPQALRLRMAGVTVDTADSGAAALDRIAAKDYDAIVTDLKMPGMDGLELLAEIRTHRPDTPTLIITGHGEHDLVVHALRGGAYDFIQKPIDRDYFVASLRRAIEMRALSRRVKEQQLALERHLNELEAIVEERTRDLRTISEAAAQVLLRYHWPGNVRELRDVIRRAVLLSSDVIEPEHLSVLPVDAATAPRERPAPVDSSLKEIAEAAAADAEQQAIRRALHTSKGNKSEAARHLRTDYKTLRLKMKQYGIEAGQFREVRGP